MGERAAAILVLAASACGSRLASPEHELPAPAPLAFSKPQTLSSAPSSGSPVASAAPTADRSAEPPPPRAACPTGMALVGRSFCIDRWEAATLATDGSEHSPYHPLGASRLRAVSVAGQVPQAHVSMQQADAACRQAAKRLCTTEQWVGACMGPGRAKHRWPYGASLRPHACNVDRRGHPLLLLHEGRRPSDAIAMNDPRINQIGSTVAPAGAFEECVTPEGVHDLVGNLLEWTRGPERDGVARPLLMGGYYLDGTVNGTGCTYVTVRHGAQYADFATGFRCCTAPDAEALREQPAVAALPVTTPARADGAPVPRDPVGLRAFDNPFGKLPPRPSAPAYEPADAACPVDMAEVSGTRCGWTQQDCLRWVDPPGMPQRACGEFKQPTSCQGARRAMRYCIDRFEHQPVSYSLPLVHVSWTEAALVCGAQEKRLCHEEEWEFACEGEEGVPYPYGYVRDGSICNNDQDELFTSRGKLLDRRVAADALPRCKSPFGVFNLVGNVDEWTTRSGSQPPHRSILRGGWWLKGRSRCRAATDAHDETYAGPQTGFRCCKEAR